MTSAKFFARILAGLVALTGIVIAHPVALPKGDPNAHPSQLRSEELHRRHSKRADGAFPRTDLDTLQYALTLEHLESAFYQQGFAKFPASDFENLGLSKEEIDGLGKIAETEATHVTQLSAAISHAGATPVQPCIYDFKFTDAKGMVATAKILEAVGISAYLGAAPLIKDRTVLSVAGSIVTVEARHQTFIRTALGESPVPQAFDVAVDPRGVFTLAASFIVECPPGSNLNIQPFPSLVIENGSAVKAGSTLTIANPSSISQGPIFCAFTSGDAGTQFTPLSGGSCVVPNGLTGEVYVNLSTDGNTLSDDNIVAGPSVLAVS